MTRLSDLEAAVLGAIWRRGPCTAYAVRKEFQDSPSSHWKASAGAIYPLIQRLRDHGLLQGRDEARGSRGRSQLTVTRAGKAALQAWIGPPVTADLAARSFDGLRTRSLFLGALPAERRDAWLDAAEVVLVEHLASLRNAHRARRGREDVFYEIATRNLLRELRGRIAWIRDARRLLAGAAE